MKKLIAISLGMCAFFNSAAAANAVEPVLIIGQISDVKGNPVPDLRFNFQFEDGEYVAGTTDSKGKFLTNGRAGNYTFRLFQSFNNCNITTFSSTFTSARETFNLTVPELVTYTFKVKNSAGNPVFGSAIKVNNPIFEAVENPKYGNPRFLCKRGIFQGQSSTFRSPETKLTSFKLDLDAMANSTESVAHLKPAITFSPLDNISGQALTNLNYEDLKDGVVDIVAEKLPGFETPTVTVAGNSKSFTVVSRIVESSVYEGIQISRKIMVAWRSRVNKASSKWNYWRYTPIFESDSEGQITSKIKTGLLGVSNKGYKVELKVVGSGFGSSSASKFFTIR